MKKIGSRYKNLLETLRQKIEPPRTRYLLQGFGGVKDVQVLSRGDDFSSQFEKQNQLVQDAQLKSTILRSIVPMWTEMLAMTGLIVVIWVMIWQGRTPERIIPLLGLFVVATWRFVP
ncbi:MAG: ABC transporter ATP-binding protein, partial [Gammaproteobacteria bacterium]|nr:ABC transporter ATP-binding protein [Gammaproteobacteria bacterium]